MQRATSDIAKIAVRARHLERRTLRALLDTARLLGLTFGIQIAQARDSGDPARALMARINELEAQLHGAEQTIRILQLRLDRIRPRRRPHYEPEARFQILSLKSLLGRTTAEVAQLFRLAPNTVDRWEAELRRRPNARTVGAAVRTRPPLRSFDEAFRRFVKTLAALGVAGNEGIARLLLREGYRISARTVGRIRKERRTPPLPPDAAPISKPVITRYPNHVWMMDVTAIPSLFGLVPFRLAGVLDGFSRMPLLMRLHLGEPSAADMAALLQAAVARFGQPRYLLSDRGVQFTARRFRRTLRRLGIRQRFAAVGAIGAVAIIERFWKTLKGASGITTSLTLSPQRIEQRLALALFHYGYLRPHAALGTATPAEVYFSGRISRVEARPPPRGRPGEPGEAPPLAVAFLDRRARSLPYLVRTAA